MAETPVITRRRIRGHRVAVLLLMGARLAHALGDVGASSQEAVPAPLAHDPAASTAAARAPEASSPTRAETAGSDDWHYAVTVYGFLPAVYGETTYPGGASGPTFTVDQHKILSNLNFAFMGTLRVRRDEWGALVDFFYSDLSDSVTASRDFKLSGKPPAGVTADLGLRSKTTMLTLAGTYTLLDTPGDSFSVLAGTRMIDLSQNLDWTLSATVPGVWEGALSGTNRFGHTNWDAIVGVTGRRRFGSDLRWYVPYHLDVGTGDSRFTGQAVLGVGYTYPWGEVTAAWRYIDYDFKFGNSISRLSFSGPALGVVYRF